MLRVGDEAPDFETEDDTGKSFKLSQYRGQKLVLYFYPKDFTPGCVAEACSIRDNYNLFAGAGIPIFGISGGTALTHQKFRGKYQLPFNILVDEELNVAKLYNAYSKLNILGMGVKRITYLIDEDGKIEAIFGGSEGMDKVRSKEHAEQLTGFWGLKL
ncbi:MAG: peroxiredoxin [Candidatus Thorarchaeota archaeon]|jgi:peroxiredoxin Q/BCP